MSWLKILGWLGKIKNFDTKKILYSIAILIVGIWGYVKYDNIYASKIRDLKEIKQKYKKEKKERIKQEKLLKVCMESNKEREERDKEEKKILIKNECEKKYKKGFEDGIEQAKIEKCDSNDCFEYSN